MRPLTIVLLALICGSCSLLNPQPTPQQRAQYLGPMLSAAGFKIIPVDTPAKTQTLKSLPPLKVNYYFGKDGVPRYWLADPYQCNCVFKGDAKAYQQYQNLRIQEQIAEREERAAALNQDAAMQMNTFNPFFFPY